MFRLVWQRVVLILLLLTLPSCSSPDAFHRRWCESTSFDNPDAAISLPPSAGAEGTIGTCEPRTSLTCLDRAEHVGVATCDMFRSMIQDYRNFYFDGTNLALLGAGVAVAAPIANTHADAGVRDWYQNHVRSPETDRASVIAKEFGNHMMTIPIYLGAMAGGALLPDTGTGNAVEDWASRTLRGLAVGAPAVGIFQVGLGSGRPGMGESSHWDPGHGVHGVAGHGFVGAMPFLAAAAMTDNLWLQTPLVAASFATSWSRINDNDHYLSQAILGWWIAYLSVRSVSQTERKRPWLHFCPCSAGGPGMGIILEH